MIRISRTPRLLTAGIFVIAFGFTAAAALPALAAADGPASTPKCKEGWTYNKKKGVCEQASLLDDETLTEAGRELALAGHYENALDALMAVRDKNDATVLTYIGYAKRKMGKVDEGISWYHKALAVDPGNLDTREYLGEGYVALGRIDLAEEQLARIEDMCGQTCEQYQALAGAIAGEPERWGI